MRLVVVLQLLIAVTLGLWGLALGDLVTVPDAVLYGTTGACLVAGFIRYGIVSPIARLLATLIAVLFAGLLIPNPLQSDLRRILGQVAPPIAELAIMLLGLRILVRGAFPRRRRRDHDDR